MVDYSKDELKDMLVREVTETVLRETGKTVSVEFRTEEKIGGPVECAVVREADSNVAPMFHLKSVEELLEEEPMSVVVRTVAKEAVKALKDCAQYEDYSRYTEKGCVIKNVIYCLVRKEGNEEILSKMVTRDFLDMSIVYRVVTRRDKSGVSSFVLPARLVQESGITEQELWTAACINTPRMFPVRINSLRKVQKEIEGAKFLGPDYPEVLPYQLVLTNEAKVNGAAAMIYEGALADIADRYQDDLVIIPTSIHECIVEPKQYGSSFSVVRGSLVETNERCVAPGERLSDHAYLYVRETGRIIIPTEEEM